MDVITGTLYIVLLVSPLAAETDHDMIKGLVASTHSIQKNVEALAKVYIGGNGARPVSSNGGQFSFTIDNSMKKPYFKQTYTADISFPQPLIGYMEEAVIVEPTFTSFQANYTSPDGYFISSINGRQGSYYEDGFYWGLLNQSGYLSNGVSKYVPQTGDQITFKLTRDASPLMYKFYIRNSPK